MKKYLALLLAVATLAAVPSSASTVTPERLAGELESYFKIRVDSTHRHETPEETTARMLQIATGAVDACTSQIALFDPQKLGWTENKCIALVTTAAKWESGLIKETHAGTHRGPAGERCLVQLHRLVSAIPNPIYRITPEELAATTGLDDEATHACMHEGVKALAWQIHRCGYRADDFLAPVKTFSQYHHPRACDDYVLSGMPAWRAASFRSLLKKIEGSK